jgi:hypothetical protein
VCALGQEGCGGRVFEAWFLRSHTTPRVRFFPQGISAVENMCGRPHVLNHNSIPAACFTHPEVSFVGVTQEKAEEMAKEGGFPLGVVKTSFKANSKALAEKEADGMAKMMFRKDTGEILGVHIIGLHAADLIHEASNAIATKQVGECVWKRAEGFGGLGLKKAAAEELLVLLSPCELWKQVKPFYQVLSRLPLLRSRSRTSSSTCMPTPPSPRSWTSCSSRPT